MQPKPADPWYRHSSEAVLSRLETRVEGLDSREARQRLQQYGPNIIKGDEPPSPWLILLHQFASPLIYVLLGALVVVLVMGHVADSIVIAAVLVLNASIGFFQEFKAERAIRALMELVAPQARVRREGREEDLPSDQLVPGDIVLLDGGNVVPADLRLLQSASLQVNEAALTGESVPGGKTDEAMGDANPDLPPGDQKNMVFLGTEVTSGRAEGVVVATGDDTRVGSIAREMRQAEVLRTPLQERMDRLARWIAAATLALSALAFVIGLLLGRTVYEMFLMAVALAVAAMPEGLPVVMTVALAVSVKRMADAGAIIRHLPAVETLGSTTVIVSDKTGTLTQNRMTVQAVIAGDRQYELTAGADITGGEVHHNGQPVQVKEDTPLYFTLLAGALNNTASLEEAPAGQAESGNGPANGSRKASSSRGSPMEVALLLSAGKAGLKVDELAERYPQIDEVPFESARRFSATIHRDQDDGPLVLVKGAPEVVVEMSSRRLDDEGREAELDPEAVLEQVRSMAANGLRVLAMAIGRGEAAVETVKREEPGGSLTLAGMQGLLDPPRPEAIDAVDGCHRSGIRVIMCTGDHAETAAAIARQLHLGRGMWQPRQAGDQTSDQNASDAPLPESRTGQEIARMSDEELDETLERVDVFARFAPEQKLRIVQRLRHAKHVVAVTGDGVNDGPALKSAHLGVAMGQTGSDVAREASQMVLTDDNFANIYDAVKEGRTSFRNLRMATFFLITTSVAIVAAILASLGLGLPLPLLPAQILWLNVVTSGLLDVSLAFEPGEEELYGRRPRPPGEGIITPILMERAVVVGLLQAAGAMVMFGWLWGGQEEDLHFARVGALTTLVIFGVFHVFNCRSEVLSPFAKSVWINKFLFFSVILSLGVHVLAMHSSPLQFLLALQPLDWRTWVVIVPLALTVLPVNQLHKRLRPDPSAAPR